MEEDIARARTSPIAGANAIARENGTEPGTTAGPAQLLGLVPVAAMVFVDPLRRPIPATAAYALVLCGVMGVRLAGLPAFRPLVPGPAETLGALFVTGAAGLAGGW